eukprot:SAG22_NODE_187_length_15860_cov_44.770446_9_plen_70_part_00
MITAFLKKHDRCLTSRNELPRYSQPYGYSAMIMRSTKLHSSYSTFGLVKRSGPVSYLAVVQDANREAFR